MIKPSVQALLYKHIFTRPRNSDPPSWDLFVQRCLVPEVRLEVQGFYGALDSVEAQYPGLDYTSPPHRRRLSRFSGHRKLFRAFEELRITRIEILTLCVWEGTKSAKDKYERDHGRCITDSTLDGIAKAGQGSEPRAYFNQGQDQNSEADLTLAGEARAVISNVRSDAVQSDAEQSDEDETDISVGVQLNQQLIAAAEARQRGEPAVFDAQWEQWMKEALDRNDMSLEAMLDALRQGQPFPTTGSQTPPTMPLSSNNTSSISGPSNNVIAASTTETIGNLQAALRELQSTNARLAADSAALSRVISGPATETAR